MSGGSGSAYDVAMSRPGDSCRKYKSSGAGATDAAAAAAADEEEEEEERAASDDKKAKERW